MKRILTTLLFLLPACVLLGQGHAVSGTVTSAADGEPLPGVVVQVQNDATRTGVFGNSEGKVYKNEIDTYSTSAWYPETTNPGWKTSGQGTGWHITIPAEYAWSAQGLKAPMMAYLSTEHPTWQAFSVLSGVIKVDINGIPANANKLVFTAPGKQVSGEFMFTEESSVRKIKTFDSATNNTVTITFPAGTETFRSFCIPVPEGTYANYTLQFYEDDTPIVGTGRRSSLTIGAKEIAYVKPYSCDSTPAERVIWQGNYNAGNWNGMSDFEMKGSFFSTIKTGQKIVVSGTENLTDGTWIGCGIKAGSSGWPAFSPEHYDSWASGTGAFERVFTLTDDDVTMIKAGGIIPYGYQISIKKISIRD